MNPDKIAAFFAQLDLTKSVDLAIAFHHFRNWPAVAPLNETAFARDLEIIEYHRPLIFGQPDDDMTARLVTEFLWELGGSEPGNTPESQRPLAPREWLCVFREAMDRGNIGPVGFGAAFGFLMVLTDGNGAPGLPADSIEARRLMLGDAKRSSPLGLMDGYERAALAELPDTVTLWRGGSLAPGEPLSARANGVHWALDRDYALTYMKGRNAERTQIALRQRGTPLWNALGRPFLLKTVAPKDVVLAYRAAGVDRSQVEVLVDFDELSTSEIQNVTPEAYRWAA